MAETTEPPAHAWMRPRVEALLREAAAAGIPRDVAVAVMLDAAGSAGVDLAPLPAETSLPTGPWPHPDDDIADAETPDLSGQLPPLVGRMP